MIQKKMIKEMTKEELSVYRHNAYMKRREKQLQKQHEYYVQHKQEIQKKANNRYKIKCGLGVKDEV